MGVDGNSGWLLANKGAQGSTRPRADRLAALASTLSLLAGLGAGIVTVEFGRHYRAQRLLHESLMTALVATGRYAKPNAVDVERTFATLFGATRPAGYGLAVGAANVRYIDKHTLVGSASASIKTVALWAIGVKSLDVSASTRIQLTVR